MDAISLESLGLSQEAIADRLVDKLADRILTEVHFDEDGFEFTGTSPIANRLNQMVRQRLDQHVEELANKHVLPMVNSMLENLVLQETNRWGEKTGKPVTFREYLVQRAEGWMTEKVNYEGKSKDEANGFSWSGTQTRVAHMIHKHLHYEIERAMREALGSATSTIAKSLHETCRLKINEAAAGLRVEVKTK